MTVDTAQVQRWLDAYTHAWMTYDPDEISALFTDDAEYRWHPWDDGDEVAHGRTTAPTTPCSSTATRRSRSGCPRITPTRRRRR
jgi:hypothetical protein